jgi:serine/threonine protein phosphatase PrpC
VTSQSFKEPRKPVVSESIRERESRILPSGSTQERLLNTLNYAQQENKKVFDNTFEYLDGSSMTLDNCHTERKLVGNHMVGICHAKGKRPTMEDEGLAVSFNFSLGGKDYPIHLFGIFDGHGGPTAAKFVRENLKQKIEKTLRDHNKEGLTEGGIFNALKVTGFELNTDFWNTYCNTRNSKLEYQGTTATIAMILDGTLWTANIGDSRTVLDNDGEASALSADAKPEDSLFSKSIRKRGGTVHENPRGVGRVNGCLSVARAIGDYFLEGAISARPKITKTLLSTIRAGAHLILGCDGVWDVASRKDVVQAVHKHKEISPEILAKNIVYSALKAGSTDNVSVLIVNMDHIKKRKWWNFLFRNSI